MSLADEARPFPMYTPPDSNDAEMASDFTFGAHRVRLHRMTP